jgi:hypothetical protein
VDIEGNVVGKESNFDAIRAAKARTDLITLEKLQEKVDAYIEQLRDQPRRAGEKKTRRMHWEQPEGTRKAPPIRHLMTMVPEKIARDTAINYWKFTFEREEHEPRLKTEEDLYRWLVAAARREDVPLRAAKLDNGWEIDICLDREANYWCTGVLKTEQYLTEEQYAPMLGRVKARARREHANKLEGLEALLTTIDIDKIYKHDVTKQPIIVTEPKDTNDKRAESSRASDASEPAPISENMPKLDGNAPKRASSVSVRAAPPRKPDVPVGRKFDWSKAPKAKDVQTRVESELQQDKENT